MLRHKNGSAEKAMPTPQPRNLSPHLTFLDVIRDCCARGGRLTLAAESSDGNAFTVLVDRGGPFNVSGNGLSGSDALVAAARLDSGSYTIADGWPVSQPLYQIGLDATLKMLSQENMPTVVGDLPSPRGVDTFRNNSTPVARPAPTVSMKTLPMPFAPAAAAGPTVPPAPLVAPAPAPAPTPAVVAVVAPPAAAVVAAPMAPAPVVAPAPASSPPAPVVPAPAPAPPAAPAQAFVPRAPIPQPLAGLVPEMPEAPVVETDPLTPGSPTASADQGGLKHKMTQALLWLVQIDEPERYTLGQARVLVSRALRTSFRGLLDPFSNRAAAHWNQAKEDWEKSGEVVAKQKARKTKRVREVDVDPQRSPLSGR